MYEFSVFVSGSNVVDTRTLLTKLLEFSWLELASEVNVEIAALKISSMLNPSLYKLFIQSDRLAACNSVSFEILETQHLTM